MFEEGFCLFVVAVVVFCWRVCAEASLKCASPPKQNNQIKQPQQQQNSWLYSNELTQVPPEVGALHHLRRLWLERNKVRCVLLCVLCCCAWV